MKVTIVAATEMEIAPTLQYFKSKPISKGIFRAEDLDIEFLVTGMGMMQTAAHMALYGSKNDRDLYIDAGIAGAFNRDIKIGALTHIVSETYGDFGVEDGDEFSDFFEMGFIDSHQDAFEYGKLRPFGSTYNYKLWNELPKVSSITVNKVHGKPESIALLTSKYKVDLENMEGLAFFYVAHQLEKDCLQIRSVSNYVEKRNKENWDIKGAIQSLNDYLIPKLEVLC